MSFVETQYEHVALDNKGVPFVHGTKFKIIELVKEKIAYGWSPEKLHIQHPSLTLGQIYSALAYYWDHQKEMDDKITIDLQESDNLRSTFETPPVLSKIQLQICN